VNIEKVRRSALRPPRFDAREKTKGAPGASQKTRAMTHGRLSLRKPGRRKIAERRRSHDKPKRLR
jgi:hypothetical protein